jgi:hypothetical protein
MRKLVESLKRLYGTVVTLEKLQAMVTSNIITEEEFAYITA